MFIGKKLHPKQIAKKSANGTAHICNCCRKRLTNRYRKPCGEVASINPDYGLGSDSKSPLNISYHSVGNSKAMAIRVVYLV